MDDGGRKSSNKIQRQEKQRSETVRIYCFTQLDLQRQPQLEEALSLSLSRNSSHGCPLFSFSRKEGTAMVQSAAKSHGPLTWVVRVLVVLLVAFVSATTIV